MIDGRRAAPAIGTPGQTMSTNTAVVSAGPPVPSAKPARRGKGVLRLRPMLLALLLGGYLAAWLAFGLIAHLLGLVLLQLVRQSPWLTFHGWLIGAAILLLAGLFQFSSLKHRCLDECRSPLPFVLSRWHGLRPHLDSARLGFAHGVFCVGCCWALMLIMFVVGTGNLGWMLVLAAVMAAEKNLPWGKRLRTPLGLGLLAWSAGIVAVNAA